MQSRRGGARSCTVLLTRGRYGFATNESRCHESARSVDRQGALRPPDTVAVYTDQDRPMSEGRRQFGVTRVSQVGTIRGGPVRTMMYENCCE